MGKKPAKRWAKLIKVLNTLAYIVIIGWALWRGLVGALIGALVFAFLGWKIWLGALVGAGLGILFFLFDPIDGFFSEVWVTTGPFNPWIDTAPADPSVTLGHNEVGRQVTIQCSLDQVFAYVADFNRYPEWNCSIHKKPRQLSEQSTGVGTSFQLAETVVGRSGKFTLAVTDWIPNQKIVYSRSNQDRNLRVKSTGGFYLFAPAHDSSGTVVTHVIQLQTQRGWQWTKHFQESLLATDLLQLRQRLEK